LPLCSPTSGFQWRGFGAAWLPNRALATVDSLAATKVGASGSLFFLPEYAAVPMIVKP